MLPLDSRARKAIPIYSGFIKYFPNAIVAVAELSRKGNDQHNPGQPLHWDRAKSGDELDALMRHTIDEVLGEDTDTDGVLHATKRAWRAMADLEKKLESRDCVIGKFAPAAGDIVQTTDVYRSNWGDISAAQDTSSWIFNGDGSDSGHREPLESCPICMAEPNIRDAIERTQKVWEVEGEGEPPPPPPNIRLNVKCDDPLCRFCGAWPRL